MSQDKFPRLYNPDRADPLPFGDVLADVLTERAELLGRLDDDNAPMLAGERFPRLYDPEPVEGFEDGGGI